MIVTVQRTKVEVLVDSPLAAMVIEAARDAGISGYTLLPTVGGEGRSGRWSDDQLSGAQAKVLFVTLTSREKSDALIEALAPWLDEYGLVVARTPVEVIRPDRF